MEGALHLKLTVRFCTEDNDRCFGPGIATLLRQVQALHSLRAAAASMGMAYSKAWRILRASESSLGYKLLSSTIGGPHGGGAVLTPQGEALLNAYEAYCDQIRIYSEALFQKQFGGGVQIPQE